MKLIDNTLKSLLLNFQTAEEYKGYTALGIYFVNFLNAIVDINKHRFITHLCTNYNWLVDCIFD